MATLLKLLATVEHVDVDARTVTAKISTETVDRDGDVLLASGCIADDFLKTGTVFFNHDYNKVIGKNNGLQINSDHVLAKTRFADRPDNHPAATEWFPDTLFSLFEQKVISSFSVGFQPIESRKATLADKKKYGANAKRIFVKWKMLEYSVAPLASNPDALAVAISKAVCCSVDTAKSIVALAQTTEPDPNELPYQMQETEGIHEFINKSISKHLQTMDKTIEDAINKHLTFGPGSKLHMMMYDIAEVVVKCVMAQEQEESVMPLDEDPDDPDEISPEIQEIAGLLEKHMQTSGQ